jgi:nitrous oxide reductase accessory protein NosL
MSGGFQKERKMQRRTIVWACLLAWPLWAGDGNLSTPAATTAPSAESHGSATWQNQRDPVYKLLLKKYPKFEAEMKLKNGKTLRFISVKSLMNFYYHPEKFPGYGVGPDGKEIVGLTVQDYLDGEKIPAEKAWYVFGSRLAGPHGDDLIPLASRTRAELFVKRFGGTKIMNYQELRSKGFGLIKYLDM